VYAVLIDAIKHHIRSFLYLDCKCSCFACRMRPHCKCICSRARTQVLALVLLQIALNWFLVFSSFPVLKRIQVIYLVSSVFTYESIEKADFLIGTYIWIWFILPEKCYIGISWIDINQTRESRIQNLSTWESVSWINMKEKRRTHQL
jgi:hypothetical protein